MTAEFGDGRGQIVEDAQESLRAQDVRQRAALGSLTIETPAIAHARAPPPQGHAQPIGHLDDYRAGRIAKMRVLMRVQMARLSPQQVAKSRELPGRFRRDLRGIVERHDLIDGRPGALLTGPFAKIEMEADRKPRMGQGIACGLSRGGPAHHQAGTRDDPLFMGLDDAAVHAAALPEIIGINNEIASGNHHCARFTNQASRPGGGPRLANLVHAQVVATNPGTSPASGPPNGGDTSRGPSRRPPAKAESHPVAEQRGKPWPGSFSVRHSMHPPSTRRRPSSLVLPPPSPNPRGRCAPCRAFPGQAHSMRRTRRETQSTAERGDVRRPGRNVRLATGWYWGLCAANAGRQRETLERGASRANSTPDRR